MTSQTRHFFVYGTLQRGQVRASVWPRSPVSVQPGRVRGHLFDLGPYPALRPGTDWVRGELWEIAPVDIAETLRVLDEVEGFRQQDDDLYRREVVECLAADRGSTSAFTYFLFSATGTATRIMPDKTGVSIWRPRNRQFEAT